MKGKVCVGGVYTMDHEVVPRPCKICDWLLNSFWDHFGLHQGNFIKVTMEFKVSKRHILKPTLFIDMVQHVLRWERQNRYSGRKKQGPSNCCFSKVLMSFFGEEKMKTREDNKRVKLDFFFKTPFFGHIFKKSSHPLFGAWSFLLVQIRFTPNKGSKDFCKLI